MTDSESRQILRVTPTGELSSVDIETPVKLLAAMITPESPAVLVRDFPADETYILTGYDVLAAL